MFVFYHGFGYLASMYPQDTGIRSSPIRAVPNVALTSLPTADVSKGVQLVGRPSPILAHAEAPPRHQSAPHPPPGRPVRSSQADSGPQGHLRPWATQVLKPESCPCTCTHASATMLIHGPDQAR